MSLELERRRVPEGSSIASAIDYRLNHWEQLEQLTRHLHDGVVPMDNNLLKRQIKPRHLGPKNWLFAAVYWPASALKW